MNAFLNISDSEQIFINDIDLSITWLKLTL